MIEMLGQRPFAAIVRCADSRVTATVENAKLNARFIQGAPPILSDLHKTAS
ncbi:MAG: hypothetical protein P1V21_00405 [Rhizobiaceae bacterium]|nr:hypothetical protein [Rhizobiaceae bacterium]